MCECVSGIGCNMGACVSGTGWVGDVGGWVLV